MINIELKLLELDKNTWIHLNVRKQMINSK